MKPRNKNLYPGDVLWIPMLEQLIEVLGGGKPGELLYWTDANPEEVGTSKCRGMSSWIVFKHGIKVAKTRRSK